MECTDKKVESVDIVVSVGIMESEVDSTGRQGCFPCSKSVRGMGIDRGQACLVRPGFAGKQLPATAGIGGAIESGWNLKQMLKLKEINGALVK